MKTCISPKPSLRILLLVVSFLLVSYALPYSAEWLSVRGEKHAFSTNKATLIEASRKFEHFDLITIPSIPSNFELEFTVFGQPVPLQRHRIARGVMFNPSKKVHRFSFG